MSRSSLLIAVSGLALAACQPASEAPQELSAETPPALEDIVETAETEAADVVEAVEETVETAAATDDDHDHADESHEHDDEHAHDDHAEDHADHDDHEHEAAHEDGDHDDEAHDHDDHDHDHAGGEAHVHGLSDLAASLDGTTLSVNIEGALANFDLDESLRTLEDTSPYTDGAVAIMGGDCTRSTASASIRPIGDHGNLVIDLTYDCASAGSIEAIEVTGFQSFVGFEEVNAVFLTGTEQTAETLTKSDTRLDLE